MTDSETIGERGRHGTHLPSMRSVTAAVRRLIDHTWGGWSRADRDELSSIVLEKYFAGFGRETLPVGPDGDPLVPVAWLRTVVRTSGIDAKRRLDARPADAVDFAAEGEATLDARLLAAARQSPSLATAVTTRIAIDRALASFEAGHPSDAQLVRWSLLRDLSIPEIAARVGKSEEATKKSVQRAASRFRVLVARELQQGGETLPLRG